MATETRPCGFTTGYQVGQCPRKASGIRKVHLAPWSASTFSTATMDVNNVISLIQTSRVHYTFDLTPETCTAEWRRRKSGQ